MLGHKQVPSRSGGVELVVTYLSLGLVRRGHRVTCYNRPGLRTGKRWQGIDLKTVPAVQARGLTALTSSATGAVCAAFGDADVVHFHAEGPAFMCFLPKWLGKRVVVTIHGLDHQRAKWGRWAARYLLQGERHAVRYADEIIVLSKDVQQYFLDTYGRKTTLIPNGVRPAKPEAPSLITTRYGLEKDGYVLFLARLVPEKGLHYLIEAFRALDTDKQLVIAGDTSDSDDYVRRVHALAKGDDRIVFTGFVKGQMLKELYSNAYLYCLPSDLEGMPLSLLEAMSYGACCLVSDIPAHTEVVEDRAVTFLHGNVRDLQTKLQTLLDHPETVRDHAQHAASFICGKYPWDTVIDRTLALYQS